ncbi:extracellular solute-binding protein [Labrenzia sp. 011]|uniref:extracellular solute-binding protein n=1 Tax=Labrenzia sp. 011 TaxID=2171494 RepID=UPI000D522686|nr:extracellular solute-binding protein [Labrenzia sp. 011]PVB60584.1 hypothetical protein DCO57_16580 [Labrenzia sp. 011]
MFKISLLSGRGLATRAAIAIIGASFALSASAGELVLYTASNPKIEKDIVDAFKSAHPEIDVKAINMSTGPITEKTLAEMANPQADVIWMVNNFALDKLKEAGALQPYTPKDNIILSAFVDPDGFWMGHNGTIMAMAVNKKLLAEKELPMPSDWSDLINPVYKGQITVASPIKSGTGYTIMSAMWDMFGDNYIENLNENVFQYNDSGSAAARQVGGGENAIGLTYDTAILQQVDANPDVEMAIGRMSPNIIEGAGLIEGAPHEAEGKIFLDWLMGKSGMEAFAPHVGVGAAAGYGKVDLSKVAFWHLRRPMNQDEFKADWSRKYE